MSAPSNDDPSTCQAAFARRVARRHGGTPDHVALLAGAVNTVVRVTGGADDWVVRFPVDPRRPNEFPMEIWVADQVSRLGIETPRLVATGHLDDRPYLVVEYITPYSDPDVDQLWWSLGRYAASLAAVPVGEGPEELFSRFGRDLPSAWRAHLGYNLDELTQRDPLIEDGVYPRQDLARLRALLETLAATEFAFGLAHGDLAPRNLIPRRPPSAPVLIDWGTATTGPAPWTDLQRVYAWAVHDRTISHQALHQFADAAGLSLGPDVTTVLDQMSALRFLDLARWARDRRPDLYDEYRQSSQQGLRTVLAAT